MRGAPRSSIGGRVVTGERRVRGAAALPPDLATARVRGFARDGIVVWSAHGLDRARAHGMTTVECYHTLRGGVSDPAELARGQWRYRVHWQRMCVVVVFRSELEAVVVDAWRKQR